MRDWLREDHLAWFVADAVEEMDLGAFYGAYREDGWGRAAFEPEMMVALLLYAYAVGERSSRGIERRCREDIALRVLAANQIPDHATIARFRARHEQASPTPSPRSWRSARRRGWSRSGCGRPRWHLGRGQRLAGGDPGLSGDPRRGRVNAGGSCRDRRVRGRRAGRGARR